MRREDFEDLVRHYLDPELIPRGFRLTPQPPADGNDDTPAAVYEADRTTSANGTVLSGPIRGAMPGASTSGSIWTLRRGRSQAPLKVHQSRP